MSTANKFGFHVCEFCEKKFIDQAKYDKHSCEYKKRFKRLGTRLGMQAFSVYSHWRKLKGYAPIEKRDFIYSKHFNSCFSFVEFAKEKMLPDNNRYIEFAVVYQLTPSQWKSQLALEKYMEIYDKVYDPEEQAEITLQIMRDMAQIIKCELGEIFEYLYPIEVLKYIQSKRFTPWVLIFSSKFSEYLKIIDERDRITIQAAMNVDYWQKMIVENREGAMAVRQMVVSAGL